MRSRLLAPRTVSVLVLAGTVGTLPAVIPAGAMRGPAASGLNGSLYAVAATSRGNAWAVGTLYKGSSEYTLTEHWSGTRWRRVRSPAPGFNSALTDVAAVSGGGAWAVGYTDIYHDIPQVSVILRWNGTAWRQVPAPYPRTTHLNGVTAFAGGGAWAAGSIPQDSPTPPPTIIDRWNGATWRRVRGVRPAQNAGGLSDVAATSARNAWAVGSTLYNPLIEHWNGTRWQPAIQTFNGGFNAVAATSRRNAWAVGSFFRGTDQRHLGGR